MLARYSVNWSTIVQIGGSQNFMEHMEIFQTVDMAHLFASEQSLATGVATVFEDGQRVVCIYVNGKRSRQS